MNRDSHLIAEAYYGNTIINELDQGVKLIYDTSLKTLLTQMFNDPSKFWELLKKTPGMYAALLSGNMKKLHEIFLGLGVDVNKISDAVQKSMELFADYQRGMPIEVRKAVAVHPQRAMPVRR
jgi:hypothetical protein